MKNTLLFLSLALLAAGSVHGKVHVKNEKEERPSRPQKDNDQKPQKDNDQKSWQIGGKLHFEEGDGSGYVGLKTLNRKTKKVLKRVFGISKEQVDCSKATKLLLKKGSNSGFILNDYEERSNPGEGEELHATLLYTKRRGHNPHETLKDVYKNLMELDKSLSEAVPPSVEEVAKLYGKAINPDWKFVISEVVLLKGGNSNGAVVAKILLNGKDKIYNKKGNSISAGPLHITLASIESSVLQDKDAQSRLDRCVIKLNESLAGKSVKVSTRKGHPDLEFGITGSTPKDRVRPDRGIIDAITHQL